jgi:hypothetical protein
MAKTDLYLVEPLRRAELHACVCSWRSRDHWPLHELQWLVHNRNESTCIAALPQTIAHIHSLADLLYVFPCSGARYPCTTFDFAFHNIFFSLTWSLAYSKDVYNGTLTFVKECILARIRAHFDKFVLRLLDGQYEPTLPEAHCILVITSLLVLYYKVTDQARLRAHGKTVLRLWSRK